jgi:MoaA/NifB/PqqE/SkfB family radical SAM enzyme
MTNPFHPLWAQVDEQGRLVLPPEIVYQFGMKPGARLRVDPDTNSLRLHPPTSRLAKVYVEPTNRCNIKCRTCMRNTWDEPLGSMSEAVFGRVIEGLQSLSHKPLVLFGGIGEPLAHPRTLEWVARVKALGGRVGLITNGTLLTAKRAQQLVDAGLDTLWVSLDGATPESYADVRLGAELPKVIENLQRLRPMRKGFYQPKPELGIAFVAMKRNIDDLPNVIALGRRLGATRFSVSNVLPYTAELRAEALYNRTLKDIAFLSSIWLPQLKFAGNHFSGANDVCTFIESGATAIGWDGSASPCPPLLHNHISYLRDRKRASRRHVIGNIVERDLIDLWNDPEYMAYRDRVQGFAFAPCTYCGGCEMLDANEEDCLGNVFPACGGCLWAQGVIQCP